MCLFTFLFLDHAVTNLPTLMKAVTKESPLIKTLVILQMYFCVVNQLKQLLHEDLLGLIPKLSHTQMSDTYLGGQRKPPSVHFRSTV
jgi:hypothetical protein